jgi:hypothetical protein
VERNYRAKDVFFRDDLEISERAALTILLLLAFPRQAKAAKI